MTSNGTGVCADDTRKLPSSVSRTEQPLPHGKLSGPVLPPAGQPTYSACAGGFLAKGGIFGWLVCSFCPNGSLDDFQAKLVIRSSEDRCLWGPSSYTR